MGALNHHTTGDEGIFMSNSHKAVLHAPYKSTTQVPQFTLQHAHTVRGARSPAANLIILCRCVSCSRNRNRVCLCEGDGAQISVWVITQRAGLFGLHFASSSCDSNIYMIFSGWKKFLFVFWNRFMTTF